MCDSSTDVTIILYDQEVRHRIVRQALLSGYEQESASVEQHATDSSCDTGCSCTTVALSVPIFESSRYDYLYRIATLVFWHVVVLFVAL